MKKYFNHAALIVIGILSIYGNSFADGVFLPEARKKIPNIPVQRALLKYRSGIETLVIESSLNGEKSDYGWIIPIPNLPLKFEKVSPGLLKTLSLQLHPKIHYDPRDRELPDDLAIWVGTLYTALILIICFIIMRWGAKYSIIPIALFVVFTILLPNFLAYHDKAYLAGPGFSSRLDPLVKIKDREVVGSYEIFMLEARDSFQLNLWLDNNGLSQFQPKAAKLIDDYIEQGWYFVVAKLNTKSDGVATPHPVLLEFESSRPVYPMKLTALSGSSIYLELYLVGDLELVPINYDIEKEYCNFFDLEKIPASKTAPELLGINLYEARKIFDRFTEIAHADASLVMWNACVLTKLAGTVASEDMKEDMFFEYKQAVPYQQTLYSPQAKLRKAYTSTLWVAVIGAIILAVFYRILRKRWKWPGMGLVWLLLLILCATGFAYTYISLDGTTDFYIEEEFRSYDPEYSPFFLFHLPENTASSGEEYIEIVNRFGIHNPITNEPIILEDSPGNLVWEKSGDEIRIKYCRRNGSLMNLQPDWLPFSMPVPQPVDNSDIGQRLPIVSPVQ